MQHEYQRFFIRSGHRRLTRQQRTACTGDPNTTPQTHGHGHGHKGTNEQDDRQPRRRGISLALLVRILDAGRQMPSPDCLTLPPLAALLTRRPGPRAPPPVARRRPGWPP